MNQIFKVELLVEENVSILSGFLDTRKVDSNFADDIVVILVPKLIVLVFDKGVVMPFGRRVPLVHDDCIKPVNMVELFLDLLVGRVFLIIQSQVF